MKNTIGLLGLLTLLFCQGLQAQELTGTILKDGKPQKNIRVWLKHNKGLAKTDKNGQFTLFDVLPTDTLVMGVSSKYDAQVAVGSQRNITIHLEDDGFIVEAGLDEVTVTAPTKIRTEYISPITLKKMNIINHNTIMRESIRSVSAAIKRFVPGAMQIGKSPSELSIIRGRNSMRLPEAPLYIIDGVPYNVTEVDSFLAIEDVAELTVDRDGSGYGARGANGVVIIRTMRGSDR
ncbi:MAG: TonB-dependent receptor plug domain-containing protein [Bacteroidaceae bacterium]|nr:TonB-dependent receptor plug domain-containing protein [Bacteroidaceae bacterium]